MPRAPMSARACACASARARARVVACLCKDCLPSSVSPAPPHSSSLPPHPPRSSQPHAHTGLPPPPLSPLPPASFCTTWQSRSGPSSTSHVRVTFESRLTRSESRPSNSASGPRPRLGRPSTAPDTAADAARAGCGPPAGIATQLHASGPGGAGQSRRIPQMKVPCLILRLDLRKQGTCWSLANVAISTLGSVLTRQAERAEISVLELLVNHDRFERLQ